MAFDNTVAFRIRVARKFAACTKYDPYDGFCNSCEGYAVGFEQHRNIGLYCGNNHQRPEQWISHYEFLQGGAYEDVPIPHGHINPEVRQKRANMVEPSKSAKKRVSDSTHCTICRRRPAKRFTNHRALLAWLKAWHADVFAEISAVLGDKVAYEFIEDQWPDHVPQALFEQALKLAQNSQIVGDHLLPVALLMMVKDRVGNRVVFNDGAKNMIIAACVSCNLERNTVGLEPMEVLEQRLFDFWFEGKRRLAEGQRVYLSFLELYGLCAEADSARKRRRAAS